LTLTGHPGVVRSSISQKCFSVCRCWVGDLTLEMTFGRGHPLECYLKKIVISSFMFLGKGFDARLNLCESTVWVLLCFLSILFGSRGTAMTLGCAGWNRPRACVLRSYRLNSEFAQKLNLTGCFEDLHLVIRIN